MSDRQAVIGRFLDTAASGDAEGFRVNLAALNWPGAYHAIFRACVNAPTVHPSIPPIFSDHLRKELRTPIRSGDGAPVSTGSVGWSLTDEFSSDLDLMAAALRLLLPLSEPATQPLVMFRGQVLADHLAGQHGVWWTPDPVHAELFARSFGRPYKGPGAVVAAFVPAEAVIARLHSIEFIVDPRLIADAFKVCEVPAYTLEETLHVLFEDYCSIYRGTSTLGIPSGFDDAGLDEWLGSGCPIAGLPRYREKRLKHLGELMERQENEWTPIPPPLPPAHQNRPATHP